MKTQIINASDSVTYEREIRAAAEVLRRGGLVVFPTETIYGVAANADSPEAMQRLRELKGKRDSTPFTLHLGAKGHARRFLTSPSVTLRRIVRKVWPGPVTVVCEEANPGATQVAKEYPQAVAEIYHGAMISLRCPNHPAAERLLNEVAAPIVASGASRSSGSAPYDAAAAIAELDGDVDAVIDAGPTRHHAPSTVLEVRGNQWKVVREGILDERSLRRLTQSEILFVCTGNSCRSPLAEYLGRERLARAAGVSLPELKDLGFQVLSAGTAAYGGGSVSSGTAEELRRRGIDPRGHRSQPLTVDLVLRAERIYVMSPEHRAVVLDLVPAAADKTELLDKTGPIADPIGGTADDYRRTSEQIERSLDVRIKELLDEDRDWQ